MKKLLVTAAKAIWGAVIWLVEPSCVCGNAQCVCSGGRAKQPGGRR
jgi:hypothetical protein